MTTKRKNAPKLISTPPKEKPSDFQRDAAQTSLCLLFHTKSNYSAKSGLALVTAHQVVEGEGGVPIIAEGHPITSADEREIIRLLLGHTAQMREFDIYPENLLFHAPGMTVWWMPSDVRPMHLVTPNGSTSISTRWPNLVLMAKQRTLFVAALAEEKRPTAKTMLFHAPLGNCYETTVVCPGDADLPLGSGIEDMEAWDRFWFDTAFTHSNHQNAIARKGKAEPVKPDEYWHARAGVKTAFPVEHLSPLKLTLEAWVNGAEELL